jgi:hypothetical protein
VDIQSQFSKACQYFLLSVFLWIIVDWGTAGGFRLAYFEKFGPALLFFYIGYPLVFSILIFKLHWSDKQLFLATLFAIFVIEVIFTKNQLVMTFPALILGIPLAILVYLPLTYFPLWFVRKEVSRHKAVILGLILVELFIILLTTFGGTNI